MKQKNPTLFVVAGEASGDLHTANLIRALKVKAPHLKFYGLGGPKMKEAGAEIFFDMTRIAALGLLEVILRYGQFRKVFYEALEKLKQKQPCAVLLTDFPGFNLRFAKQAKKLGFPIIYYVSPQVWAWKKRRIHSIPKIVDKMMVILPFEKPLYQNSRMEVDFVGHPLLEHVMATKSRAALTEEFHLDDSRRIVTLAPGSRKDEVKRILPVLVATANLLHLRNPSIQFLIAKFPNLHQAQYNEILKAAKFSYQLIEGRTYDCLSLADFSLVKSGTTTLEATLLGAPYALVYKVSPFTYALGRLLVTIRHLGLANIIAGKTIVPEFIQMRAKPKAIAEAVEAFLSKPEKIAQMKSDLARVRAALETPHPSQKAAQSVLDFLNK